MLVFRVGAPLAYYLCPLRFRGHQRNLSSGRCPASATWSVVSFPLGVFSIGKFATVLLSTLQSATAVLRLEHLT